MSEDKNCWKCVNDPSNRMKKIIFDHNRFWNPVNDPPIYYEMLNWLDSEVEKAIDSAFHSSHVCLLEVNDSEIVFDFETDFNRPNKNEPFCKRFKLSDIVICFEPDELDYLADRLEAFARNIRDKAKQ